MRNNFKLNNALECKALKLGRVALKLKFKLQISSRFTIAIHVLTCIDYFSGSEYSITSEFLAGSIQVNPVIIRQILLMLKSAGFISVSRGRTGKITLARPLNAITFYDVYQAVECVNNNKLFKFHENPNPNCPVGKNIHAALDDKLNQIQFAMEDKLRSITLDQVADYIKNIKD